MSPLILFAGVVQPPVQTIRQSVYYYMTLRKAANSHIWDGRARETDLKYKLFIQKVCDYFSVNWLLISCHMSNEIDAKTFQK